MLDHETEERLGATRRANLRFELSEDQELFRATGEKFLGREYPQSRIRQLAESEGSGFEKSVWRRCAELGWASMFGPDSLGGGSISGNAVEDMCLIAEEAGRVLAPLPIAGVNVVVAALAEGAAGEDALALLEPLMRGEVTAAWAYEEPDGRWRPDALLASADLDGHTVTLTGRKTLVQYGADVDFLLVTARTGRGLTQVVVPCDSAGVSVTRLVSLDLLHEYAVVAFDGVRVPSTWLVDGVGAADEQIYRQFCLFAALQCAETVGGMAKAFETTLEYAQSRYAFGRPIGSFQALKHRIADMLTWLESCRGAAEAAATLAGTSSWLMTTTVAIAYIGTFGTQVLQECTQVHGGIGLTWEHDLHLFLRRVSSNRSVLGTPEEHKEALCAQLEAAYYPASQERDGGTGNRAEGVA